MRADSSSIQLLRTPFQALGKGAGVLAPGLQTSLMTVMGLENLGEIEGVWLGGDGQGRAFEGWRVDR